MAELRIGSGPFFERGIERIVDAPEPSEALVLPDAQGLAPAASARWAALDELLHAENLESLLEDWARPELAQRELLAPQRFRAAMDGALARLQGLMQPGTDASQRELLERAERVLAKERELRDLLQMNRSALLQG
jgi:hypothetical protein